jgi:hypothetical protein
MMQTGGGSLGGWSQLIVGHQWPSEMTIAGLHAWIENRGQIADAHDNIADLLNAAKTAPLAAQQGKTADALVQVFDEGEQLARDVARKNGVKKDSYSAALGSVHNLRSKLSDIADRYNQEINKILESKEPAAVKVPHILETIGRGQQEANLAAANCGGDIGDAGQRILDQEGTGQSFHHFAKNNGIDTGQFFRSRDTKGLESTVDGMLNGNGLSGGGGVPGMSPAVSGLSGGAVGGATGGMSGAVPAGASPAVSGLSGSAVGGAAGGMSGAVPAGVSPAVSGGAGGSAGGGAVPAGIGSTTSGPVARPAVFTTTPGLSPPGAPPPAAPPPIAPAGPPGSPPPVPTGFGGGPPPAAPPPGSPPPVPTGFGGGPPPAAPPPGSPPLVPTGYGTGTVPTPSAPSGPASAAPSPMFSQGLSNFGGGPPSGSPGMPFNGGAFQGGPPPSFGGPGEFMHHADAGFGPAGAGAVPPAAPIAPQAAPTPVSPQTAPTAGSGDWHSPIPTEQPSAAQAPSSSYSPQAASPMMSAPSSTNAGMPSTSAPSGALPAYGSDLRPPVASVPAGSPSLPPPLASSSLPPGSPTTSPAAGSGGVANTAAARPVPMSSLQQPAPVGIADKAIVASAGGAVAGAVSADATARNRLQRIVDAVARQEPRLAWAAGDRPDDITVLITDLAGGWIPPGIDIPSAITLLEPGRRRGDLEALLGEVKSAVTHTPDRYVPEADEPVPTSPRPRHAPEIEELGWELSSATLYRDGLPRMAHTLAKAASSGTGVDGLEVEKLHEYLDVIGERVLDAYPDEVDPKDLGNWQLLAAIEALVRGDRTGANYHLAWFQARMTTAAGQQR